MLKLFFNTKTKENVGEQKNIRTSAVKKHFQKEKNRNTAENI